MTEPRGVCKLLISCCIESLRLLNIKSKRPVLPPGPPSAPGNCGIDTAAGAKSSSVHARCDDDDDEEPYPKKSKTETVAGARTVKLVLKRPPTSLQSATEENSDHEHKDPTVTESTPAAQVKPHPQSVTEGNKEQEHKDPTVADATPSAQVKPHPQSAIEGNNDNGHEHGHEDPTGADTTPAAQAKPHTQSATEETDDHEHEYEHKDTAAADTTPAGQAKPHHQPPVTRNDLKHDPIVIKDEDEDEETRSTDASPAPREYPGREQSQPDVPTTPSKPDDQARRERKKEILNNRLKQLKIEQQLLEMED